MEQPASLRNAVCFVVEFFRIKGLLPDKVAFQLNDTHPSVAVAELMRVLVDENDVPSAMIAIFRIFSGSLP